MTEPHLDDESLSAFLDGDDSAVAHLAGCATCRARRDALDAARRAVAAPPPPAPAAAADRAVAAAMAAFDAGRPTAPVVPLARPAGSPGTPRRAHAAPRRRRGVPAWAFGIAAAVAAVAVAVPVLTRDTSSRDASRTAAGPATTVPSGPVIDAGDLGDQSDQLALGRIVTGALGKSAAEAPAAADRSAAPEAGFAASTTAQQASPAPSPAATAGTDCERIVRSDYGSGLGALEYRATLRWQGTPAALYAYTLTGTDKHRVFVMSQAGCRLLVVQGF